MRMVNRFICIAGVVLFLFPFLHIFSVWKDWIAFGIGVCLIVCCVYETIRGGGDNKK